MLSRALSTVERDRSKASSKLEGLQGEPCWVACARTGGCACFDTLLRCAAPPLSMLVGSGLSGFPLVHGGGSRGDGQSRFAVLHGCLAWLLGAHWREGRGNKHAE